MNRLRFALCLSWILLALMSLASLHASFGCALLRRHSPWAMQCGFDRGSIVLGNASESFRPLTADERQKDTSKDIFDCWIAPTSDVLLGPQQFGISVSTKLGSTIVVFGPWAAVALWGIVVCAIELWYLGGNAGPGLSVIFAAAVVMILAGVIAWGNVSILPGHLLPFADLSPFLFTSERQTHRLCLALGSGAAAYTLLASIPYKRLATTHRLVVRSTAVVCILLSASATTTWIVHLIRCDAARGWTTYPSLSELQPACDSRLASILTMGTALLLLTLISRWRSNVVATASNTNISASTHQPGSTT